MKKWVVVANSDEANIFSASASGETLEKVHSLPADLGHLHASTLTREGGGQATGDDTHNRRAAHGFAKELVDFLERQHQSKEFSELVLVAPAKVMGDLRKMVSKGLDNAVSEQIVKDVVAQDAKHIQKLVSQNT